MRLAWLLLAACGQAAAPIAKPVVIAADAGVDSAITDDEKLAAIQKAMNDLAPASQECWAASAAIRFDVEGELAAQIDIGAPNHVAFVRDTTKNPALAACVQKLLETYPWAPPLRGQAIQLPFKFSAPDGQSVIDRRLVPFARQGPTDKVSVAVLLDENNDGNPAASMFEVALAAGGTTGMRTATRGEIWMLLDGEVEVSSVAMKPQKLAGVMQVPAGGARELHAVTEAHLVVVVTPGQPEGAARMGTLPTPEVTAVVSAPIKPLFPKPVHAKGHELYVETQPMSAAIATIPKGTTIAEHVHAKETELLFFTAGAGTLTVNGVAIPITPTSVVQIPPNTKHSFTATEECRALQLYTPAGPEQRFKL